MRPALRQIALFAAVVAFAAMAWPWRQDVSTPAGIARPQALTTAARITKAPLMFEPNRGQVDPAILFLSRGPGYDLRLDRDGAAVTLNRAKSNRTVRLDLAGAT